jgi:hypothetical protein
MIGGEVSSMAGRAVKVKVQSELETIRAKMLEVVQPEEVERWLTTPKKFLNGARRCKRLKMGKGKEF